MKITVLVDNNTYIDHYHLGEPALSFYIEDVDLCMLFDTGYSDVFIQNALSLGIDLSNVSKIILSHGHNDHTRGMTFIEDDFFNKEVEIIAHPDIFLDRCENNKAIGAPFSLADLQDKYKLTISKEPIYINDRLCFLGEIPTYFEFEKRNSVGMIRISLLNYRILLWMIRL